MKKLLLLFSLILLFSFIPKEETISGMLYFKMIEFVNTYGLNNEQQNLYNKMVADIRLKKNPTKDEQALISQVDAIKQAGLEKSPYMKVKTADGKVLLVFLTEDEYKSFSGYKLKDLQDENKKVMVKLNATEVKPSIYKSKKVLEVQKIDGLTPWDK